MLKHIDPEHLEVAVVGAGSWGTALANLLAEKGSAVDLWVLEPEIKRQIQNQRENKRFLPGVTLSANIRPSTRLPKVISQKELVVVVVPSHVMRGVAGEMAAFLRREAAVVSASKGIENKTHLSMTGVLQDVLPKLKPSRFAALSGPSFAAEVARGHPTLVTVAATNQQLGTLIQQVFATPFFRVYTNDDTTGTELGGAVKNVIAIAAGIVDGLGFGLNTRAALITRGLTEIRRLGLKLGARPRTFTGLAGMGDLLLTCTGKLSRNHTIGEKIGRGQKLKDILADMHMVAEGVRTAKSVYNLSRKLKVDMPICHEVYHILYEDLSPRQALMRLMTRDLKQELDKS